MDHHALKPRWPVAALLLSAALAPASLTAQNADEVSDAEEVAVDETARLWFVEFNSAPTIEGAGAAAVAQEKQAFRRSAASARLEYQERYSFGTLWNGVSVEINPDHVAKLARLPGVKAVYPVIKFTPPAPSANPGMDLVTAVKQTGADIAQNTLGFTGAGIKVAIMDTGVDFDHPDLGGCFGAGCRVFTGWDFVGDAFNADDTSPTFNPIATPDPIPDDCNGHGTHVAGIVGANGAIRGVAPDVTFGAYRVFGCDGSTTAEIMIAAMERAYADGMDVLNMSIGSAFQWPEYPTAVAASRLVKKGMVVVASIGNSGTSGLYAAGAPGLGKDVIGVASFDNTHVLLPAFTISPDDTKIGHTGATGSPPAPTSGSFPMSKTGTAASASDACTATGAPAAGSLTGTVVLIRRGGCTFHEKAANAQAAGAAGVVLYNNAAGFINPTVVGPVEITIPVVAITAGEGALIDSRLAGGAVTMTWTTGTVSLANPTGNLISSFSSYGLSPDLALKPDIGAPGGSINSTYPLELGGNANISGTSMSSPHVAGAAALLLQADPDLPARRVRDILQNSADPKAWWGNPALGFLDNVHRQGAGMVDIDDAIETAAGTYVQPGKLSLGESQSGPSVHRLEIRNYSNTRVTYDLSYVNALSTGGVITPQFFASDATVTFSSPSVTTPRNGWATFTATINPATGPNLGQYGGYIVLTPTDGGRVLRVPFAGFVGDYQSITVLTPTANGFPWLAKLSGDNFTNQSGGATYSMENGDIPYFLAHFDHQARRFTMRVTEIKTNSDGTRRKIRSWHKILDEEFFGRNSTTSAFFSFAWDGQTFAGKGAQQTFTVPNGQYVVTLEVLKALGSTSNPAHTESWESPLITIARQPN
jgi:minor extracellular serine protease Vpr